MCNPPLEAGWRQCLLKEDHVEAILDHGLQQLVSFWADALHVPLQNFQPGGGVPQVIASLWTSIVMRLKPRLDGPHLCWRGPLVMAVAASCLPRPTGSSGRLSRSRLFHQPGDNDANQDTHLPTQSTRERRQPRVQQGLQPMPRIALSDFMDGTAETAAGASLSAPL